MNQDEIALAALVVAHDLIVEIALGLKTVLGLYGLKYKSAAQAKLKLRSHVYTIFRGHFRGAVPVTSVRPRRYHIRSRPHRSVLNSDGD